LRRIRLVWPELAGIVFRLLSQPAPQAAAVGA
jgi:hypothetical protein